MVVEVQLGARLACGPLARAGLRRNDGPCAGLIEHEAREGALRIEVVDVDRRVHREVVERRQVARQFEGADAATLIDWRRSGRADSHFVQEREWQAAQCPSPSTR